MVRKSGKCYSILGSVNVYTGHGRIKNGDAVLGRTTQEKDLGVTFSADMKVSEHCGIAASKGNYTSVILYLCCIFQFTMHTLLVIY